MSKKTENSTCGYLLMHNIVFVSNCITGDAASCEIDRERYSLIRRSEVTGHESTRLWSTKLSAVVAPMSSRPQSQDTLYNTGQCKMRHLPLGKHVMSAGFQLDFPPTFSIWRKSTKIFINSNNTFFKTHVQNSSRHNYSKQMQSFGYHGNNGRSGANLHDSVKLPNPETPSNILHVSLLCPSLALWSLHRA